MLPEGARRGCGHPKFIEAYCKLAAPVYTSCTRAIPPSRVIIIHDAVCLPPVCISCSLLPTTVILQPIRLRFLAISRHHWSVQAAIHLNQRLRRLRDRSFRPREQLRPFPCPIHQGVATIRHIESTRPEKASRQRSSRHSLVNSGTKPVDRPAEVSTQSSILIGERMLR